ncbi:hypothetical protein IAT38_006303 [Cryptococcus sp. DSM 104549]
MPLPPTPYNPSLPGRPSQRPTNKPALNMDASDPSSWLGFSLPPRSRAGVPGSGVPGVPRRSRKAEGWRGGVMSREKFVNASFKFVLKPNEPLAYGAHFADPDISLHWPHILQILVPTFSPLSVAQGYVTTDAHGHAHDHSHPHAHEQLGASFESADLEEMGEEAAERRRRMEEERRGRMCPICLGNPVAGRMTECGHIFCFPCILHYIQLSDVPKSTKCPICGDAIHLRMLKSVKYLDAGAMLRASAGEDAPDDGPSEAGTSSARRDKPGDAHSAGGAGVFGAMEGFEEALSEAEALDAPPPAETSVPTAAGDSHAAPPGHRIHMRLIQRPQMTTLALPSSPTWPSDAVPPHTAPWFFLPDIVPFSRYMLASPSYMSRELARERAELQAEWDALKGDELGRVFVKAAMEKVEGQMEKVRGELETGAVRRAEEKGREAWGEAVGGERRERERQKERERRAKEREERARAEAEVAQRDNPTDVPREFLAAHPSTFDNAHNILIPPNLPVQPNPMPPPKKSRRRGAPSSSSAPPSIPPGQSYYFYQSSLGANVFLHPLDIRILLAHYQSYSLFPSSLAFTATGYDPGTINEELRKRCKYLSHLPLGTEVVFVEADLLPLVGAAGLAAFEQPLKARRAKRRERTKKEDKAKIKWEKAERDKLPVGVRSVPSAFIAGGGPSAAYDHDFALALARSAVEFDQNFAPLGSSPSSSTHMAYPQPQAGAGVSSSPPEGGWGARPSFATALHTRSTGAGAGGAGDRRREAEWEVDLAWAAFEELGVRDGEGGPRARGGGAVGSGAGEAGREAGGEREKESAPAEPAGGKKGKKGKGQKLVLGGGGGRRA